MKKEILDIIIVGGGATGAGIALDASLRGFSVALFEQNDFAEGTSSRSTKLVHGGVRYLEAAVKGFDKSQYALVKEGLRERKLFLQNASHLAHPIELITPLYKWYEIPYIYAGLFLYDVIAGKASLGRSRLLSASKAKSLNPSINQVGLKAAVSYYDGAFNDSRMTIALLQTAQRHGAKIHNHMEVVELSKENNKKINGVTIRNKLTGKISTYNAQIIVNAAGPFVDNIRKLDNTNCSPLVQASSGIHIVVDKKFLPSTLGLMIPKTSDGRVLFVLPYQGKCLIGTSDKSSTIDEHPIATKGDIEYLLKNVNKYFDIKVNTDDILSSFCGLRPLISQDENMDTSKMVREHIEEFSSSGLLTVAGGKWTSYRSMAESAVNIVSKKLNIDSTCETMHHRVIGSQLSREKVMSELLEKNISKQRAQHLYSLYGDQSMQVLELDKNKEYNKPLLSTIQTTQSELIYCMRHEYVKKPLDFIARRINIGLTDRKTTQKLIPKICDIMQAELQWSDKVRESLEKEAMELC